LELPQFSGSFRFPNKRLGEEARVPHRVGAMNDEGRCQVVTQSRQVIYKQHKFSAAVHYTLARVTGESSNLPNKRGERGCVREGRRAWVPYRVGVIIDEGGGQVPTQG
jgi:hypothetical protein